MNNLTEPKIYINSGHINTRPHLRMTVNNETYILEGTIELLEKLASENGWKETQKLGQKIKRAKINS